MSGNDLYCDLRISVLIIVEYYLALICGVLAVVMNREIFLFLFVTSRRVVNDFKDSWFQNLLTRTPEILFLLLLRVQCS